MQTVTLDLSRKNIIPPVHAKQGDVGRKFKAVLTDAGVTYAIPRGAQFSVWYSGASGEGNYSAIGDTSAFTVEENVVTVELITQMVTNSGTGTMCLILSGADGSQIGLWNITYVVEAVPGIGSEAAENYYTALSEVAEKAVKAAETFQTDTTMTVSGRAADAATVGVMLEGKAPAGYGLGVNSKWVTDRTKINGCGFYQLDPAGGDGPTKDESWWGEASQLSSGVLTFTVTRWDGCTATSKNLGNGWNEWEWVNPPMIPGEEYRTTERWDGKAVYTKLVDFGALPNAANKMVNIGINASQIFRVDFKVYDGTEMCSDIGNSTYAGAVTIYENSLSVYTQKNLSAFNGMATIWYTKD